MRTLKKTLCLVLAVVMILGLGVIGVSAKDYTDSDSVAHKEAVAILSAVGVFEGDDTGAFNGSKALTRAEGAAVVTRLLGVENPNGATTFADTANHWAKGYIAYCADLGIMNGYGDGNFGPDDALTAAMFAKFLLVALGYNPAQENMTGASWEIGVTKLVNVIDLAHDMGGLSYTGAITRDDAAKMAYNCLKKNMVEYRDNKTITAGDVSIVESNKYTDVDNTSYSYMMEGSSANYDGQEETKGDSTTGKMQFVENYFPNLKLEKKADDFGVPQNYWYLASSRTDYTRDDNENIVKEASDDLLATYTDAVVPKTIRDAIGSEAVKALKNFGDGSTKNVMNVIIDGVTLTAAKFSKTDTATDNEDEAIEHWAGTADGSSDNIKELGRGVITRVYRNTDNQVVTIVVNGVYLAKAVADFDGKELPVEIYNDGKGIYAADVNTPYANTAAVPTEIKQEDVDVSSFKKDDYLLLTMTAKDTSKWKVQTAELAETVEDVTLNSFRYVPEKNQGAAGNIVAGGKYYMFNLSAELNANAKGYSKYVDPEDVKNEDGSTTVKTGDLKANDNTYKFWLDKNGYIIGLDEVESTVKAEDYVFVTAVQSSELEAKAKVVFLADGTEKTITVNKLFGNNNDEHKTADIYDYTGDGSSVAYDVNNATLEKEHFYKYKEKSSGEYELTKVAQSGSGIQELPTALPTTTTMTASSSTPLKDGNGKTLSYFANAKSVAVADKKAYVGVRNFPTIDNTENKKFYVLLDGSTILAVYTDAKGSGTADKNQYALLINGASKGKDGDDTIYTYDAVINGEMTRVVVSDDSTYSTGEDVLPTALFEISTTDNKGNVKIGDSDLIKNTSDSTSRHDLMMAKGKLEGSSTNNRTLKVEDDVLKYSLKANGVETNKSIAVVDSNTKYYEIDCTNGHAATLKTISDGSVGNLDTSNNWLVYAIKDGAKDKAASVVYFVKMTYNAYTQGDFVSDYAFLDTINS